MRRLRTYCRPKRLPLFDIVASILLIWKSSLQIIPCIMSWLQYSHGSYLAPISSPLEGPLTLARFQPARSGARLAPRRSLRHGLAAPRLPGRYLVPVGSRHTLPRFRLPETWKQRVLRAKNVRSLLDGLWASKVVSSHSTLQQLRETSCCPTCWAIMSVISRN